LAQIGVSAHIRAAPNNILSSIFYANIFGETAGRGIGAISGYETIQVSSGPVSISMLVVGSSGKSPSTV
jgi:hypothetical protein